MTRMSQPTAAAFLLVTLFAPHQSSQAAAPQKSDAPKETAPRPLADPSDDPLPERACGRLGNLRFRNGERLDKVAFTPDGTRLVTADYGGIIRIWDAVTGEGRSPLLQSTNGSFALSKDGKRLATLCDPRPGVSVFHLLDLPSAKEISLPDLPPGFGAYDFSPDGKLMVGSAPGTTPDLTLLVCDTKMGRKRFELKGHKNFVYAAVFSPDGRYLASAGGLDSSDKGGDTTIRLWDMEKGTLVAELEGHEKLVKSLSFSPDGKMLASASWDHTIRLWDVEKRNCFRQISTISQLVAFSPDGKKIVTADSGTTANSGPMAIRFWDPNTGEQILSIKDAPQGIVSLCFSPDGKRLATVNLSRTIHLWDTQTGKEIITNPGHCNPVVAVAFSPDGKYLASRGTDTTVRLWDVVSRQLRWSRTFFDRYETDERWMSDSGLHSLSFSPDGNALAGLGASVRVPDHSFHVWDVRSGDVLADFKHQWYPMFVAFAPDGDALASGDEHGVYFWSYASRKEISRCDIPTEDRRASDFTSFAAFSPDCRTVAVSCADRPHVIRLRDWRTGELLREISIGKEWCRCLAFSPNGRLLAGCNPSTVHVWETATGALLGKYADQFKGVAVSATASAMVERYGKMGFKDGASCIAFAPDGRRVVATTGDFIDVWDVFTGELLSGSHDKPLFKGHKGAVYCAAFSPDGKTIASGSADTTILLWDAHDLLPKTPATHPTAKDLDRLWDDLRSDDAPTAYKAVLALLGAPDQAATLLKERVTPTPKPDAQRVKQLIADLDGNDFETREAASRDLAALGEAVEPALHAALAAGPSPEARGRCERLLAAIGKGTLDADGLRRLRAVGVLERLGTAEARGVLKTLADGAPGRIRREAQLSLERMERR